MFKRYLPIIILALVAVIRVIPCYKTLCFVEESFERFSQINKYRILVLDHFSDIAKKYLPSPHSELVLGMVLGVDEFNKIPVFKRALVDTGTIHVVVVSGFNISLVFTIIMGIIGSPYKVSNLIIGLLTSLIYALLTGFEPPVIRSWVMGSIAALGKFYGRSMDVAYVLFFTGLLLIVITPSNLFSLSFQLSFLATLGLVLFESKFSMLLSNKKSIFMQDLSATLAAQVMVWPLISFHFERVSLISPLVNMLTLWTVPVATVIGGVFLIGTYLLPLLGHLLAVPLYVFLDIFVEIVLLFSTQSWGNLEYKISNSMLILYFITTFIVLYVCRGRRSVV